MLPPIIPLSAAPVTTQQDPVRHTPNIPAVVPAQATSSESTIDLKHQHPEEQGFLLRDEQRRRQQQRRKPADDEAFDAVPGDELNADNTVPVAPLCERSRQGLLVDIEV